MAAQATTEDEFVQPIDQDNDTESGGAAQSVEQTTYNPEEVEELVVKLRKQEYTPSEIGLQLRDRYGIGSVQDKTGKTITAILDEHDATPDIPEDLENVIRRAVNIREHLEENPSDANADHQLQQVEAQIRSMADYYRENNKLPADWSYEPDKARLLIS